MAIKGIPTGKMAKFGTGKGSSPTNTVAGGPGKSFAQKPMAGPGGGGGGAGTGGGKGGGGLPASMRKALGKKR